MVLTLFYLFHCADRGSGFAAFALVASGFVSGSEISYFSLTPQPLDDDDDEHGPEGEMPVCAVCSPCRSVCSPLF